MTAARERDRAVDPAGGPAAREGADTESADNESAARGDAGAKSAAGPDAPDERGAAAEGLPRAGEPAPTGPATTDPAATADPVAAHPVAVADPVAPAPGTPASAAPPLFLADADADADGATDRPLMAPSERDDLDDRLHRATGRFVDDPPGAVDDACVVLDDLGTRIAALLAERRDACRDLTRNARTAEGTANTETERLRLALRDSRDLAERLLKL